WARSTLGRGRAVDRARPTHRGDRHRRRRLGRRELGRASADGGSPITGYQVKAVPSNAVVTVGADQLTAHFAGLTNGRAYRFKVRAVTAVGPGAWSDLSSPVTPAGPPLAPRSVHAAGAVK